MYLCPLVSDALLESSLPANWQVNSGAWTWNVNEGVFVASSGTNYAALIYKSLTLIWPADQWSRVQFLQTPAYSGPAVRISTDGKSYYALLVNVDTGRLSIIKYVSGVMSVLASAPYTPTAGDIFLIGVQGTAITGIVSGSTGITLNATDTSIASGGAGIGGYKNTGGGGPLMQNWTGGSLPYPLFALPQGPATYGGAFFPIKKWARFSTIVQTPIALSAEVRVSLTPFPIWMWDYDLKNLFGDAGTASSAYQYVQGFFMSMLGSANPFLFTDPFDNSVLAMPFGTGAVGSPVPDGTNKAFQLTRALASGFDIAQSPDSSVIILVGGVAEPQAVPVPLPASLTSIAGGSIGGTTYYVRQTYVTPNGETIASTETSLAVSASNLLKVLSPTSIPGGITGWNVYVSTSTTTETKQNASPIAIGTAWTEPTSGLISGSGLPVNHTAGWAIGPSGIVTFNGAPPVGAVLAWSGPFLFLCRFDSDELQGFQEKFYSLWELSSLKFQSVIQ